MKNSSNIAFIVSFHKLNKNNKFLVNVINLKKCTSEIKDRIKNIMFLLFFIFYIKLLLPVVFIKYKEIITKFIL